MAQRSALVTNIAQILSWFIHPKPSKSNPLGGDPTCCINWESGMSFFASTYHWWAWFKGAPTGNKLFCVVWEVQTCFQAKPHVLCVATKKHERSYGDFIRRTLPHLSPKQKKQQQLAGAIGTPFGNPRIRFIHSQRFSQPEKLNASQPSSRRVALRSVHVPTASDRIRPRAGASPGRIRGLGPRGPGRPLHGVQHLRGRHRELA